MIFDKLLLVIFSTLFGYMCCYFGKFKDLQVHYEQLESILNNGGGDFDRCN